MRMIFSFPIAERYMVSGYLGADASKVVNLTRSFSLAAVTRQTGHTIRALEISQPVLVPKSRAL